MVNACSLSLSIFSLSILCCTWTEKVLFAKGIGWQITESHLRKPNDNLIYYVPNEMWNWPISKIISQNRPKLSLWLSSIWILNHLHQNDLNEIKKKRKVNVCVCLVNCIANCYFVFRPLHLQYHTYIRSLSLSLICISYLQVHG